MAMLEVSVDNKYTVVQSDDGSTYVTRYNQYWRDVTGDNLVLALAYEVDRLREGLKTLKVAVNDKQPDPGAVMFISGLLKE